MNVAHKEYTGEMMLESWDPLEANWSKTQDKNKAIHIDIQARRKGEAY